jgi:hypothetical protein
MCWYVNIFLAPRLLLLKPSLCLAMSNVRRMNRETVTFDADQARFILLSPCALTRTTAGMCNDTGDVWH